MMTYRTAGPTVLLAAFAMTGIAPAEGAPIGDPAVALHVTNGGLARLGDAVEALLPSTIVLEDGAGEYACSEDTGDALMYELSGMELLLSADEVALTTTDGRLDLNLYGTLNSTEGVLTVSGNCSVFENLADTCAVQLPTTAFEGNMAISMEAVDGEITASAEGPTLTISPIGNPLGGDDCSLDSAVGTLLGQNEMAITDLILDAVGSSLDSVGTDLSGSLEDALAGLVIDTSFAAGDSEVGITLEPAVVELEASGMIIGMAANISPADVSDCIDIGNADDIAPGDWPTFSETADGSTLEYDIGFFVGKSFMDMLLQEIWAGGGLCIDLADLSGVPLGTTLMGGFIGEEFEALFPENEDSLLAVRPAWPPYTVFDEDGAPIRAQIDEMGLGYWANLDHRMAGIFEVGVTLEAGIDVSIGTEELATALVLDPALMNFEETWSEFLGPGYSEGLAENLPSLVSSFLPEDTLPTIALPEILGIEIDTVIWQPTTDDEWQAAYIMLDTSGVAPIEISGCGVDALGCGGESTAPEFDFGEALGCSSTDDALGCEEASSDCGGCSASGRLPIPVSRFGLLGVLGLGVFIRRRLE